MAKKNRKDMYIVLLKQQYTYRGLAADVTHIRIYETQYAVRRNDGSYGPTGKSTAAVFDTAADANDFGKAYEQAIRGDEDHARDWERLISWRVLKYDDPSISPALPFKNLYEVLKYLSKNPGAPRTRLQEVIWVSQGRALDVPIPKGHWNTLFTEWRKAEWLRFNSKYEYFITTKGVKRLLELHLKYAYADKQWPMDDVSDILVLGDWLEDQGDDMCEVLRKEFSEKC